MKQQREEILVCKNDKVVEGTAEAKIPFWKSKVIWFAILQFLLVKYGGHIDDWVEKNSHWYSGIVGIILIYLRFFTAGKIKFKN